MVQRVKLTAIVPPDQFGKRLDQALVAIFPEYSRSGIKKWILDQQVLLNGKIWKKPKEKVLGGEAITINVKIIEEMLFEAQDIPLDIVYEDNDILVINKPRNLVVHPGVRNTNGTIFNALLHYHPLAANLPRAGIIHRLDKDTTGLMVIAKTIPAQVRLVESLQEREIIREYEGVVIGHIAADGVIDAPICRHPTKRTRMSVHPIGRPSVTYYQVIERFRIHTHLRLRLKTGRRHQIRVHMAHITHPLVGDQVYGGCPDPPKGGSKVFITTLCNFNHQALHASRLRLKHPITGVKIECYAPIPQDMQELIKAMRADFEDHKIK